MPGPSGGFAFWLRLMPQVSENDRLTKRTLDVWQPRTLKALTAEDAREIIENVTGLFKILWSWSETEGRKGQESDLGETVSPFPTQIVTTIADCPKTFTSIRSVK